MRLIDADALRESLFESSQFDTYNDYSMVIDTKGKWIKRGRKVQCSECGRFTTVKENYCPSCGLDMREEKQDEKVK